MCICVGVPTSSAVVIIEEYFTAADVKEIEKKLDRAFEPFKRKGKDTDNEEGDMR